MRGHNGAKGLHPLAAGKDLRAACEAGVYKKYTLAWLCMGYAGQSLRKKPMLFFSSDDSPPSAFVLSVISASSSYTLATEAIISWMLAAFSCAAAAEFCAEATIFARTVSSSSACSIMLSIWLVDWWILSVTVSNISPVFFDIFFLVVDHRAHFCHTLHSFGGVFRQAFDHNTNILYRFICLDR